MKIKYYYCFCMAVSSFIAMLSICSNNDKGTLFGILGTLIAGIYYLAAKIDEMNE